MGPLSPSFGRVSGTDVTGPVILSECHPWVVALLVEKALSEPGRYHSMHSICPHYYLPLRPLAVAVELWGPEALWGPAAALNPAVREPGAM